MRRFFQLVDKRNRKILERNPASAICINQQDVLHYLAEFEKWVDVRLLHRTTRKPSLTIAAAQMLPRCRQIIELATDMKTVETMLAGFLGERFTLEPYEINYLRKILF